MSERPFKIESRYTVAEVAECLEKHYGIISAAAHELQVGRNNLSRYLRRHPEAWEAYKQSREKLVDRAENTLVKALEAFKADPKSAIDAAKFILQYMGGEERGYSSRQKVEVTGKDGAPIIPPSIIIQPVKVEHDEKEK
jgi:hypothetical protein